MRTEEPVLEILLVEDNLADVRILQEAFLLAKVPVHWNVVPDGEEAISYLKREGVYSECPTPGMVLLDLNLPKVDGLVVLARIKSNVWLRRTPVFVMSSSTRREDIEDAYALNANCYVPKQMDLDHLIELGVQVRDFWMQTVRLPEGPELAREIPAKSLDRPPAALQ